MALDPRFIVTSDLESYFVDKDSGAPLAGGTVEFFRQNNQSIRKAVYQISVNSPGVYTYTALPNPCILSDVGTFQDALGNNIVPYYFPFDGTPDSTNGTQDLYFIRVYSSGGILQFTRNGWPNSAANSSSSSSLDVTNFIPNGQFLAHNNIVSATEPPVESVTQGIITVNSQLIAQGGWSFRLNSTSTSTFSNNFQAIVGPITGLNDTPQYLFNMICTAYSAATTQVADLTISWPDVNKFSSPSADQDYTLTFAHESGDSGSYSFDIYAIYNFGTGGSPSSPIQTLIGSFTTTTAWTYKVVNISGFTQNAGILGSNNDSSISLAIRCKSVSNAKFTDFSLLIGSFDLSSTTSFPVQTNANMFSQAVAGTMPTPDPDGQDLLLPMILTAKGVKFDHSQVGTIVAKLSLVASDTEILMNGAPFLFSAFSPAGVPYSRLGNYLIANSQVTNTPMFGTGPTFATLFAVVGQPTHFYLEINTPGASTTAAVGTSGFSVAIIVALSKFEFTVTAVPTTGTYFTFTSYQPGPINYYVWYTSTGLDDPAPGGTGIRVNLTGSDTTTTIATNTIIAVNRYQFYIPNLGGYFLRGLGGIDPDAASRTLQLTYSGSPENLTGSYLGTIESYQIQSHTHSISPAFVSNNGASNSTVTPGNGDNAKGAITIGNTGGSETRPVNFAVNYFIKI